MNQALVRLFRSCSRPARPAACRRRPRCRPLLEVLEDRAVPTAITVTIATDPLQAHTGTSLRDAIKAVNAGSNDAIAFNIPGSGTEELDVKAALPAIHKPVTIDGTTQPGYDSSTGIPLIALTRANKGVAGTGLRFTGGGATVKGLAIYGFAGYGLHFKSGGGNNVLADFVGVTPVGAAAGNGLAGVFLDHADNDVISSSTISHNRHRGILVNGSAHVVIGGTGAGNTISGNGPKDPTWAGIAIIHGSWDVTVSHNTLTGNGRGIRVSGSGGTLPAGGTYSITIDHNTVKGNTTQGVLIDNVFGGASHNVLLQGNDIEGNAGAGIKMNHSTNVALTLDTVSGNGKDGIRVGKGSQAVSFSTDTIEDNKGYGVDILPRAVASPDQTNTILNNVLGDVHRG
jgi:parallel beta-helix repeat protein